MTAWVHSAITDRRGLVKTETRPRAAKCPGKDLTPVPPPTLIRRRRECYVGGRVPDRLETKHTIKTAPPGP